MSNKVEDIWFMVFEAMLSLLSYWILFGFDRIKNFICEQLYPIIYEEPCNCIPTNEHYLLLPFAETGKDYHQVRELQQDLERLQLPSDCPVPAPSSVQDASI
jgi:hypothetical protein